jgi:cytidylate kinase
VSESPAPIVVALDGPAGAGKSTIARRLAARLGFIYIDTGAMYRAVALWAVRQQKSIEDHAALERLAVDAEIGLESNPPRVWLNGEEITGLIRTPEIAQGASKASAIAGVRRALVDKQRELAKTASVVMEGRDIGTVVFPNAQVKIFLDAAPEERARRRLEDPAAASAGLTFEAVLRDINERDQRDRNRAESPLRQADDAIYLDSTKLTIEEVEERILALVRERAGAQIASATTTSISK